MANAIECLLVNDRFLLENDLNERTITHWLAIYLQEAFPGWNVDCEYNRNHYDPKRINIQARASRTDNTQGSTVFPDIIVHERNSDNNLLVIDVTKSTNPTNNNEDLEKLTEYI